uniref:Uncharacterized protein n=1 Tax=Anguilla anguilla TaxID=7936 RepID=A0A0E9U7M3_ANGAN
MLYLHYARHNGTHAVYNVPLLTPFVH